MKKEIKALNTIFGVALFLSAQNVVLGQEGETLQSSPIHFTTLRALDKITARITEIELIGTEPKKFGTLEIVSRTCKSRPPEETPETYAFLEIDDYNSEGEKERVFTGWMMSSSPALNPLEHPVYDVWVTSCRIEEGDASSSIE